MNLQSEPDYSRESLFNTLEEIMGEALISDPLYQLRKQQCLEMIEPDAEMLAAVNSDRRIRLIVDDALTIQEVTALQTICVEIMRLLNDQKRLRLFLSKVPMQYRRVIHRLIGEDLSDEDRI